MARQPDTPCVLRVASPGDEDALSLIGRATFLESYAGVLPVADITVHCGYAHDAAVYRRWLEDARTRTWVIEAEQGGAPVGYMVLTEPDLPLEGLSADDYEIRRIYLLHRFQGQGIGRQLIRAATEYARTIGAARLLLGVYSRNTTALAFYNNLGFRTVGRRVFHVGSNDYDDWILALSIER